MLMNFIRFVGSALILAAVVGGCQASGSTGNGGGTGGGGTYVCTPACNGAVCGSDGCGGICGTCGDGKVCGGGQCVSSGGGGGSSCTDDCQTSTCMNSTTLSKCTYGSDGCKHAQTVTCSGGQVCQSATAACGACGQNSQCPGNDICDAGSCENSNGKKYVFTLISATVPETDTDGSSWDVPGGLPDPYACVYLDDVKVGCTSESANTLSPYWGQQIETTVYVSQKVSIMLFDNEASPDYMSGVEYGDTAMLLKAGGKSGAMPAEGYTLSFTVAPK